MAESTAPFRLLEATITDIHNAYRSGQLTAHQLVRMYLERIEGYEKNGPTLNAIVTVSSKALKRT
jgi:amidase